MHDDEWSTPAKRDALIEVLTALGVYPPRKPPSTYRSETIANLAKALAAAQGEIANASKDRNNPHFNQRYATLASVWDACRVPLSKNGLAITQLVRIEDEVCHVETILLHESGEWLRMELSLVARDMTPQAMGSVITYGRRYGLSAMVGVAPDDDDDANAAQEEARPRWEQRKPAPQTTRPDPAIFQERDRMAAEAHPSQLQRNVDDIIIKLKSADSLEAGQKLMPRIQALPEAYRTKGTPIRAAYAEMLARFPASVPPAQETPPVPAEPSDPPPPEGAK